MTREETKKHFKSWCQGHIGNTASNEDCHMFNNIMALLEQEPTTKNDLGVDAVSRQAVLDKKELVELEDGQSFYCINPEDVETLPSVTPQEPMVEIDLYSVIKQKYIEREVLDKIRAEIMQLDNDIEAVDCDYNDMAQIEIVHIICREEVLRIIDKYKNRK